MLPSGAVSRISPSRGFSAANTTRKGAPFHGAIGEGRNASSAASSQAPGEPSACESIPEKRTKKNATATSDAAALEATTSWRPGNNCAPCSLVTHYTFIAQTVAEITAKIDLRAWISIHPPSLRPPSRSTQGAVAHLNCSSTNHFLSLREQFVARPGACGGAPADWGKPQWLRPPQIPLLGRGENRVPRRVN